MDSNSSAMRPTMGDSDGVKHLKEVMRNISRLHSEATSPQAKAEGWGLSQSDDPRYAQPDREKKVEKPKKKEEDDIEYDLARLGLTHEDDMCADLAGDDLQGGVLRNCGSRISGLCARLQNLESQGLREPAAYDSDPSSGIRIVDRPEEAASVQRARADRAAAKDIAKHAKFPPLDILDETINKCQGFGELRQHFQARHRHHPQMVFLTDYALSDRGKFSSAIWQSGEGQGAESSSGPSRSNSATQLRGPGKQSQFGGSSGLVGRRTRFRRDLSAPSFSGT